jgi:aspartate-semialdehyde dehydrogenase
MRVAVVGATGLVGREMIRTLEARAFPVDELVLLASERSEGRRIRFRDEDVTTDRLSAEALRGVDIALFSAGAEVSRVTVADAAAQGTVCIDNSSAFRDDPAVPLVVPEVNADALEPGVRVVANPNCTTIVVVMAVAPLHRAAGLRSMVVSSYQSVSGAGGAAIRELADQVGKMHGAEEELLRPDLRSLPVGEVFEKTIAFNVLPFQGGRSDDDWSGEERKVLKEARKILGESDLDVAATVVRVPVVAGHSASIYARFDRPLDPEEARALLAQFPGVRVVDDPGRGEYPTPLEAAGRDEVLVGRIRRAAGDDHALLLFAAGDNLRKGAALNAVQIAEVLIR